jgi:Ser/Thr protein kinase RdoA (MazF antagonist)
MENEAKVLVPLTKAEILRLMSALANKPNREPKDELLYDRLEYYQQEVSQYQERLSSLDFDEIPF